MEAKELSEDKKEPTIEKKEVTRRSMLKWTGALVAAGAVGAVGGLGVGMTLQPTAVSPTVTTVTTTATAIATATEAGSGHGPETFVYSTCKGTACHDSCAVKTVVINGKIDRLERLPDLPFPESDIPAICQKGLLAHRLIDNPDRLLYPMKRVGERGEGKFERISWEKAMDEVGAKLLEIKDQYGAESVGIQSFPCGSAGSLFAPLWIRFCEAFGAVETEHPQIDQGLPTAIYMEGGPRYAVPANGMFPRLVFKGMKYIIVWGNSPVMNRPTMTSRFILDAKDKGAKLVVIDLWYDATAGKADQFLGIRGGTDAALALAMCHVIVEENKYDWNFMANYTVAPFLVRNDNGLFLRESDIVKDGDKTKWVWWDAVSKSAQPMAGHVHEFPLGTYPDFEATPTVKGIACKTAWVKLKENLAQYTPEFQEPITGIPAETAIQIARELATKKPAVIKLDYGIRYVNQIKSYRAIKLLGALTGAEVCTAQPTGQSYNFAMNNAAIQYPEGMEKSRWGPGANKGGGSGIRWRDELTATLTGQPVVDGTMGYRPHTVMPIHAMIWVVGNNVQSLPSRQNWEKLISKLDLLVVYEYRMSESAKWADYVFPDVISYESYDLIGAQLYGPTWNHIMLQEPGQPPPGEAKPCAYFWSQLAKRVGVEQYFPYEKNEQWLEKWVTDCKHPAVAGINPPLTWERLKKEKMIRANVPLEDADPYRPGNPTGPLDFTTASGRLEFYAERYVGSGDAMTKYVPPRWFEGKAKGYPLQYLNTRSRYTMQSQFIEDAIVQQWLDKRPVVRINPTDAEPRGIKTGDLVEVFNDRGSFKAHALLSQIYAPGTVGTYFAWRKHEYQEGCSQYLMVPVSVPETDPTETPLLGAAAFLVDGADPLWDNCCEVRKA